MFPPLAVRKQIKNNRGIPGERERLRWQNGKKQWKVETLLASSNNPFPNHEDVCDMRLTWGQGSLRPWEGAKGKRDGQRQEENEKVIDTPENTAGIKSIEERRGDWRSLQWQTGFWLGGGDEALQVKGNNGEILGTKDVITQGNECWRVVIHGICIKRVTGQYSRDCQREYWRRGGALLTDKPADIIDTLWKNWKAGKSS